MSEARSAILDRIRKANQSGVNSASGPDAVEQRLQQKQRGPLPQWSEENELRFFTKLQKAGGTINKIHHKNELVPEIVSYLNQHDLPPRLVCAPSKLLNDLVWPDSFEVDRRAAEASDSTVVTEAFVAVAETGSIVLCSSRETPTTLNFLPDNFLCVVRQEQIVSHMEDVWDRMRQEKDEMPRAVNFITGPSRTADVEQTIQMGAHGPRHLHVILLE